MFDTLIVIIQLNETSEKIMNNQIKSKEKIMIIVLMIMIIIKKKKLNERVKRKKEYSESNRIE